MFLVTCFSFLSTTVVDCPLLRRIQSFQLEVHQMAEKRAAPPTTADELSIALPMTPSPAVDLSHLLVSNDPPLDAQIPFVQPLLTLTQLRVDALNARIDALTSSATMDQLLRERYKALKWF
ncbi:hypothetical protein C8R44DRAFT_882534 [Mycena epipterygia]|nr:hypothetical protein C8R44DRAFT_882534 [Mycena epipterygia]